MSQVSAPPVPPLLLDAKALAVALNLSIAVIRRMRAEGALPPPLAMPGRRAVRWRRADLEAWIAALPAPATGR